MDLMPPVSIEDLDTSTVKSSIVFEALSKPGFTQATSKREQIGFLFQELIESGEATHSDIARLFGVSRACIEKHYSKFKNGTKQNGKPSVITPEVREGLLEWMNENIEMEKWPTLFDITQFLNENFQIFITRDGISKYIKREFKDFHVVTAEPMDSKRVEVPKSVIEEYFDKLEKAIEDVDYRFCFNLDETGESEASDIRAVKVIVPKEIPKKQVKITFDRSSRRFTILHTISADGKFFKPFIIIPTQKLKGDFLKYYDSDEIG